jgi:hypothetical protein
MNSREGLFFFYYSVISFLLCHLLSPYLPFFYLYIFRDFLFTLFLILAFLKEYYVYNRTENWSSCKEWRVMNSVGHKQACSASGWGSH